MNNPLGTLVYDEIPFAIIDIYLREGKMWFVGRAHGIPPSSPTTRFMRIYAPDKSVIIESIIDVPGWDDGDTVTVEQSISMSSSIWESMQEEAGR